MMGATVTGETDCAIFPTVSGGRELASFSMVRGGNLVIMFFRAPTGTCVEYNTDESINPYRSKWLV